MCGFAGEFLFGNGRADLDLARRMAARLAHRGPDEEGAYLSPDGRCAIGFRRLAVIDPTSSHQPMTIADGRDTVAFNGEIYNFRELREQLAGEGCSFRTAGDTEVLLHLYRRHGIDMLGRLTGMFAFALYDAAKGKLILARDRLGEKPLWYATLPDRIIFASEAKSILAHPLVDKTMSFEAITYYFAVGYIPAPASAFRSLAKLPPACYIELAGSPGSPRRYWSPKPAPVPASDNEAAELVRNCVMRCVQARMISDVPLGALLSGGLDSSIVVAAMAKAAGRVGGVRTFTAAFDDEEFNEAPAAQEVAAFLGVKHVALPVRPAPAELVDQVVLMYDEPFGDSSALPTFLVCKEARRHVTVALTGDGGDEVFGGYDRYRALHLAATMSPFLYACTRLVAKIIGPFSPRDERSRLRRLVRFADSLTYPSSQQYLIYRSLFCASDLARLFTPDFQSRVDIEAPTEWFCSLYESVDLGDEPSIAQHHDLATYLPDDLLVKTDIASMASSLELRSPFLDHELVSLGLSLPVDMKIRHGRGKYILREAFRGFLPPEVFNRPKRGFGVPLGRWLRRELRPMLEETLLDSALERRGIFNRQALAGLMNDHFAGRDDHRHRLWALLVFARWLALRGG